MLSPETIAKIAAERGDTVVNSPVGGNPPPASGSSLFKQKVQEKKQAESGVMFPAKQGEGLVMAGLKSVGNLPQSAFNVGKSLVDLAGTAAGAIANPAETAKSIGKFGTAVAQKFTEGEQPEEAALNEKLKNIETYVNERYGTSFGDKKFSFDDMLNKLQKTATEDPFGFGTDIVGLLTGGATLAGKGAAMTKVLSKGAQVATKPVSKVVNTVKKGVGDTAGFTTSQVTGLNKDTIAQIIENPQAFGKNRDIAGSRARIASGVKNALDDRLEELSELGKGYESVRTAQGAVDIPEDLVTTVLNKYGVKLDDKGQIVTSSESRPLSSADRGALQDFISGYGKETTLSNNAFLNVREALSNLSKYEQGKTSLPQQIARDLRAQYDAIGKEKIKGLKELDTEYAPERELLGQLKRDIIDPKTGDLKDGAINKIANITGKGKENILTRMKAIVPDIEERVRLVKAIEDIEAASGFKVGTYVRAGAAMTGLATGNLPVIIGAILSQPEIAVPLLRAYGYVGQKAAPIVNTLNTIVNDVNNFRLPSPVINYIEDYKKNPSIGLQISKKINPEKIAKNMDDVDLSRSRRLYDRLVNSKGVQLTNAEFEFDNFAKDFDFDPTDFTTTESKALMLEDIIKRKEAIINDGLSSQEVPGKAAGKNQKLESPSSLPDDTTKLVKSQIQPSEVPLSTADRIIEKKSIKNMNQTQRD